MYVFAKEDHGTRSRMASCGPKPARLTTSKLFLWMTRSKTGDLRGQWTQIISDVCIQFFLLHARCNGGSTWVSQTFKTIQGTRRIRITPIKSSRRLYSLECLGLSTRRAEAAVGDNAQPCPHSWQHFGHRQGHPSFQGRVYRYYTRHCTGPHSLTRTTDEMYGHNQI